jgi:hypothetical protein
MKNTFDIFYIMLNEFYCGNLFYFHSNVTSGSIWSWFCYVVTGCLFSFVNGTVLGMWSSQDFSGIHERHHLLRQDLLSHHLKKFICGINIFFFLVLLVGKMGQIPWNKMFSR